MCSHQRAWDDIPVFFRAPPARAGDFSLLGQREVTKRKATPRTRPPHVLVLRIRSRPPGFADGTSLCLRRTGALPVRHPADLSVVRSPCSRGPVWRTSCARDGAKRVADSRFVRGHGWPSLERSTRLCTTPSIAAPSGSKARMFEHRDVRVRAGPLGARSAGKFRRHDVAETGVLGAMVLATFAETKVARPRSGRNRSLVRRTEKDMDVVADRLESLTLGTPREVQCMSRGDGASVHVQRAGTSNLRSPRFWPRPPRARGLRRLFAQVRAAPPAQFRPAARASSAQPGHR